MHQFYPSVRMDADEADPRDRRVGNGAVDWRWGRAAACYDARRMQHATRRLPL